MQQDDKQTQPLWFLRRQGRVTGPFPSGAVRRFVLLGRVDLDDEVSRKRSHWQPIRSLPEVVPPDIRKAMEQGDREQIMPDLLREDERTGLDRRQQAAAAPEASQRRTGERRQDEPELLKRHRQAKTELRSQKQRRRLPLPAMLVTGVLFLLAIGYGFYLGAPPAVTDPVCGAAAAPGVVWRNCRLDGLVAESSNLQGAQMSNAILRGSRLSGSLLNGADLQYADLSNADLSYAEFRDARMKGANLRNSDLSNADLSGADLSYADLQDARISGAMFELTRLDNAIWIDGNKCLPGSVGRCAKR